MPGIEVQRFYIEHLQVGLSACVPVIGQVVDPSTM